MPVPTQASQTGTVPEPRRAQSATSSAAVLNVEPNDDFVFIHYPNSPTAWAVETRGVDVPTLLPTVNPIVVVEGAFGIRTLSPGEDPANRFDTMHNLLRKRGAILIESKPGTPTEYGCVTDCRGGVFHHTPWQILRQPLDGQQMTPEIDRAKYAAWREALVTTGVVPPASSAVLEAMENALKLRIEQADAESVEMPADRRAAKMDAAQRALDTFKSARRPWIVEEPTKGRKGAA